MNKEKLEMLRIETATRFAEKLLLDRRGNAATLSVDQLTALAVNLTNGVFRQLVADPIPETMRTILDVINGGPTKQLEPTHHCDISEVEGWADLVRMHGPNEMVFSDAGDYRVYRPGDGPIVVGIRDDGRTFGATGDHVAVMSTLFPSRWVATMSRVSEAEDWDLQHLDLDMEREDDNEKDV